MTIAAGQAVGRYQIIEPLGEGGMATVYKAHQPALDRVVALKVIRAGFAEDREFMERFEREAKAIARLQHPNIVQVHDYDHAGDRPFIAMQYLDGGTLKARLASLAQVGARMPQTEVLRVVRQIAEALMHAHGLNVLHRDVKPANVMLTKDGRAVVTDFGIAKILGTTQHTQTGVGVGTPEYMSPEQGQGAPVVDQRADVYSLGVMAYEMLTGRVPFSADTPVAVVLKHMRDPLPMPSTFNPEIGPATERVLMKVLAKEPEDRYETAGAFASALEDALAKDHPATAKTIITTSRTPVVAAAGAAVGFAALPRRQLVAGAFGVAALLALGGAVLALQGAPRAGNAPTPTASAGSTAAATQAPVVIGAPTATPAPTPKPSPTAPAAWGAKPADSQTRLAVFSSSHQVVRVGDVVTFQFGIGAAWACDGTLQPVGLGYAKISRPPGEAQLVDWSPREFPGRTDARVDAAPGSVQWIFGQGPAMPPNCPPGTTVKTEPAPGIELKTTWQILKPTGRWDTAYGEAQNNQGTGFASLPFGVVENE